MFWNSPVPVEIEFDTAIGRLNLFLCNKKTGIKCLVEKESECVF